MKTKQAILKHTAQFKRPKQYRRFGDVLETNPGELIYQDNGGEILFVGHLDCVMWGKPKASKGRISKCPQLDDRLGVAIILELLSEIISEPFDILLCDLEEVGQSTAQYFRTDKQYRWCCEFDRAGSDCVLYQYDDGTLADTISDCGIEIGRGAFSDISYLDHLGCQCVNWGCGYHDQHTKGCYARIAEVDSQIAKFANWYQHYGKRSFPYVEEQTDWYASYDTRTSTSKYGKSRNNDFTIEYVTCHNCGFADNWAIDDYCAECSESLLLAKG